MVEISCVITPNLIDASRYGTSDIETKEFVDSVVEEIIL